MALDSPSTSVGLDCSPNKLEYVHFESPSELPVVLLAQCSFYQCEIEMLFVFDENTDVQVLTGPQESESPGQDPGHHYLEKLPWLILMQIPTQLGALAWREQQYSPPHSTWLSRNHWTETIFLDKQVPTCSVAQHHENADSWAPLSRALIWLV